MADDPEVADDGKLLTFLQGTRSWVLRGVPDSNKAAAAVVRMPPKPGSAGLDQSLSERMFC